MHRASAPSPVSAGPTCHGWPAQSGAAGFFLQTSRPIQIHLFGKPLEPVGPDCIPDSPAALCGLAGLARFRALSSPTVIRAEPRRRGSETPLAWLLCGSGCSD